MNAGLLAQLTGHRHRAGDSLRRETQSSEVEVAVLNVFIFANPVEVGAAGLLRNIHVTNQTWQHTSAHLTDDRLVAQDVDELFRQKLSRYQFATLAGGFLLQLTLHQHFVRHVEATRLFAACVSNGERHFTLKAGL
ncbi:hypothetical protein [Vibrio phage VP882]|uniref:Uncharacterized protein n=1 Tax=Vibrio phage VP882 TaxID=2913982 RepID=A2I2W9_9CAUD|nr:hypothetical protein VPVV882_gp09 [Vibrio phage VP882]ABM73383.1 hypothetical protein [Vibrio phage VP882]